MSVRFERAFQALTAAYFDGTLFKANCCACAVGNIVGVAMGGRVNTDGGFELYGRESYKNTFWKKIFCTKHGFQETHFGSYTIDEVKLFHLTGYSAIELAQVEFAFETNTIIKTVYDKYPPYCSQQDILEDQYNGLAAVIDVLCRLDNIESITEHQQAFRKHPKLITA